MKIILLHILQISPLVTDKHFGRFAIVSDYRKPSEYITKEYYL